MNPNSDIYTQLQQDHGALTHLFEQLRSQAAADPQGHQERLGELTHRLRQHGAAEDEVFYAALRQHGAAQSLVQAHAQERTRLDTQLRDLEGTAAHEAPWQAKVQDLRATFDQHVQHVEGPVFTQARTLLNPTEARDLGERFARQRERPTTGTAAQYAPQATAQARDMGARAQHEAQRLGTEAKAKGRSLLHEQQRAIAEQVGGLAAALHQTATHLEEQDHDMVAQYTDQAAQGLERFSTSLGERDLGAVMGEVEDFARRQPAVFLGSAALLGFLAARFLKSSAASRQEHAAARPHDGDTPRPQAPLGPGAAAGARPSGVPADEARQPTTRGGGN